MTLYERLGGVYAIAAVVDDFIDRIMDDPRLNANPKVNEAHHRVSRAGFKYLVEHGYPYAGKAATLRSIAPNSRRARCHSPSVALNMAPDLTMTQFTRLAEIGRSCRSCPSPHPGRRQLRRPSG